MAAVHFLFGLLVAFECADAAPTFTSATSATINEIAVVGTTVITLVATPGVNAAAITYALTSQTPTSSPLKFEILTADVKVLTADLNQATQASYTLMITATEADKSVATQSLVVTVAKNVAPVFTAASPASLTVADSSSQGTAVGTVTATDANSDKLTYSIDASGNTNTNFIIDDTTGVISVATGKTLVRATTPSYNLTVKASDSVLEAASTVSVCVGTTEQCGGNSAGINTAGMMTLVGVLLAMLGHIY